VRNRRWHRALPMLLALCCLLTTPMGAAAGDLNKAHVERLIARIDSSADPVAAFSQLNADERAAVNDYLGNGTIEITTSPVQAVNASGSPAKSAGLVAAAAETCWTITKTLNFNNYFGTTLWQWKQRADWCGNGSKITRKLYWNYWGVVRADFWTYRAHTANQGGGVNFTYWTTFAQAEFKYCPPLSPCLNTKYPWIDMTMRPNGIVDGRMGT